MTAATALARLRDLGVTVAVRGGGLAVRPASVVPPDLLADLRLHKQELLAMLADPAGGAGATADHAAAAVVGAAAAADRQRDEVVPEPAAMPPPEPLARPRRPAGSPSEEMVNALAEALARRPGHRITDPAKALRYYRADARRRLSLLDDPLARGLLVGFWRHRRAQRQPSVWAWGRQP